jgi:hypothetical protein
VPVSEGGREQAVLHRICHRMIHRLFDEKRLARDLNTAEALRTAPEMQGFLRWIGRLARTAGPPRPQPTPALTSVSETYCAACPPTSRAILRRSDHRARNFCAMQNFAMDIYFN